MLAWCDEVLGGAWCYGPVTLAEARPELYVTEFYPYIMIIPEQYLGSGKRLNGVTRMSHDSRVVHPQPKPV